MKVLELGPKRSVWGALGANADAKFDAAAPRGALRRPGTHLSQFGLIAPGPTAPARGPDGTSD